MIISLASALLAAAQPQCSLKRLDVCEATSEIAGSPGFDSAVRRWVGPGRTTWYEPNSPRARQLLQVLYGPSGRPEAVGPDLLRLDACYPHVCSIRGTLFVSRAGEIRGAALLYPDCGGRTCRGEEGLKLTILRDPAHPEVPALARAWAERDIADRRARYEFNRDALTRTEIVDVPRRRASQRR